MQRGDFTDEEFSIKIAKQLEKLCHNDKKSKESEAEQAAKKPMILVIDEVDQFSNYEKSFTVLVRNLLNSGYECNVSIVGIANSVDLPFRKKHSAIAMRDC